MADGEFIKHLKKELTRLQEERRKYDDKVEILKRLLQIYGEDSQVSTSEQICVKMPPLDLATSVHAELSVTPKQSDLAFRILKEANRPMHVRELRDEMLHRGIQFRAKKPELSISSALLKDERFIHVGRNTFSLREQKRNKNAPPA